MKINVVLTNKINNLRFSNGESKFPCYEIPKTQPFNRRIGVPYFLGCHTIFIYNHRVMEEKLKLDTVSHTHTLSTRNLST
jgi:hypothetical protein